MQEIRIDIYRAREDLRDIDRRLLRTDEMSARAQEELTLLKNCVRTAINVLRP